MRVLFIIGQLAKGGSEQQLFYLATTLPAETSVVVMRQHDPSDYWGEPLRQAGVPVHEVKRRGALNLPRLRDLMRVIRDQKPDIIHIFSDNLNAVYGRLAALLASHAPVVVNVRHHPGSEPFWFYRLKRHVLNSHIAALVANSQAATDDLIRRRVLHPQRIYHVPNGLNTRRFERPAAPVWPSGLPEDWRDCLIVGTVANLHYLKNPQLFVQVARLVLDAMPEARFIHAGKGHLLAEVQQQARAAGIADKIIFLGGRDDIPQVLHAMSVFVLTSDSEGTPNAVMEAMAAALPCVVTDVGDCRTLVQDGVTGYVSAVGDAAALARGVLELLRVAELRHQMGQAAQTRIQAYSIDSMVAAFQEIYQRILDDGSKRAS